MGVIFAAGLGYLLGFLVVLIGIAALNTVAVLQIITKAGYSGWWVMAPASAVLLALVIFAISLHAAISFSAISLRTASDLVWVEFFVDLFNWILFLIFAFSDWPALRGRPLGGLQSRYQGTPASAGGMGAAVSSRQAPPLPTPTRPQDPGWYQVGATNNDQAYWDGQSWTARRRWEGAGWTGVPLAPSEPEQQTRGAGSQGARSRD